MRMIKLIGFFLLSSWFQQVVADDNAHWIDVRTGLEFNMGHLEVAHHIPVGEISDRIAEVTSDKNAPIYLYCMSGGRAGKAKEQLEALGYTQVENVGGYNEAKQRWSATSKTAE